MRTSHSMQRALVRAEQGGLSARECLAKAEWACKQVKGSAAVLLASLGRDQMVGRAWSEESNGDLLYAVIRDGRVITIFWRRSTQDCSPAAFQVERVYSLVGK